MKIDYQLNYPAIIHSRSEQIHLGLFFKALLQASPRGTPFSFGMVLDNSGSMTGIPLESAKAAAKMVVTHMRPEDSIGVVVFSDSARTVIPLQKTHDKPHLHKLIDSIQPEGSTNLTAGWMLGRDELLKGAADSPRKVLLLTDGHLNAGITEPDLVRQIVGSGLEKEKVRTSCLGFGDGYNEDLLNAIARAGGGAVHDADSAEKFPAIFQQELHSLLKLSAQNIRVRVKKLHYCSGANLISDYPVVTLPEGGFEIALGDLVSEEERVLVLSLEVLPLPVLPESMPEVSLEGEPLLELEILYDEIVPEGVLSKREERTVRVLAAQTEADVSLNETVIEWVAEQTTGRTISEAIKDRDRGDVSALEKRISSTQERLARYNRPEKTGKASNALEQFKHTSQDWSSRSRKQSYQFASRAMQSSSFYAIEGDNAQNLLRLFRDLQQRGVFKVDYSTLGSLDSSSPQIDYNSLYGRAAGCLIGGAVGDALGRCREGQLPGGEPVTEYQSSPEATAGPKGTITQNTQFTLWLADSLAQRDGLDPQDVFARFTREHIRGIKDSTREFLRNAKVPGKQWFESGVPSAGNGAAVRSAPIGLFYQELMPVLKFASVMQSIITHNDLMAIASGVMTGYAVALLLRGNSSDLSTLASRQTLCRKLAAAISGMEDGVDYKTRNSGEPATLYERFSNDLPLWLEQGLDPLEVNDRYGSGGYVLETLPHAFYCFLRTPDDFRETLLQAVNTSRDSAAVGTIACSLSGVFNGLGAIPHAYHAELEFKDELTTVATMLLR